MLNKLLNKESLQSVSIDFLWMGGGLFLGFIVKTFFM